MKYLDHTFSEPAENLACDEALLDWCENGLQTEILRVWEPQEYFVVVGYGNRVRTEVNVPVCRERGVPILRRCSGGGTVLQGPGCLNYSLILRIDEQGPTQSIPGTNRFVMERQREALAPLLGVDVHVRGHTDLTLGGLKFSGNAQRRRRHWLIFHGSYLLDFDIALMEVLLHKPSREPDYREGRSHRDFLMNLNLPAKAVKEALRKFWGAEVPLSELPDAAALAEKRYRQDEWNLRNEGS